MCQGCCAIDCRIFIPGNEALLPRAVAAPFWKAEENGRDFHFSERIGKFLEEADARLEDPAFAAVLKEVNSM